MACTPGQAERQLQGRHYREVRAEAETDRVYAPVPDAGKQADQLHHVAPAAGGTPGDRSEGAESDRAQRARTCLPHLLLRDCDWSWGSTGRSSMVPSARRAGTGRVAKPRFDYEASASW